MVDLDKLERLHAEAAGTPYKAKGDWIYAQSVSHKRTFSRRPIAYTVDNRDGRYKPTETATYIVAACNAVLELIQRIRELETEANILAQQLSPVHGDPKFDVNYWRNWAKKKREMENAR